jgi:hypothetical protein
LVHILSTAVTPKILQSDNGNEFLGKCIRIIKTFYSYLHIVKGQTYHPQSQGKIERGHSTLKEPLQKWMESNGDNWVVGSYVVNHEVNKQSQFNHGERFSPYNFYYGKTHLGNKETIFGEVAHQYCESEYGIMAAHLFSKKAQKIASSRLITEEELRYVMKRGDDMFDLAVSGNMELNYVEDYKEGLHEIVQESLQHFNFFEDDISPQIDEQEGTDMDEENDLSQNNSDHEGINDASEEESSAESSKSMENSSKDRAVMSKKQKYKYQFKTNLFEADICDMKKRHKDFLQIAQSSDDESDKSATSYIGLTVKQHKHYQKPKFTKTSLCEKRATMELIASKCQKNQGEQVNRNRKLADNFKQVLQAGDIGAV